MPDRIIAGNWKMHGSRAFVAEYAQGLRQALAPGADLTVVLLPPAILLADLRTACAGIDVEFGVQTVHPEPEGAFTGELAAEMAADAGARWTLVGHSERRACQGEDDAAVAARFLAARRAGLRPMLCVGETLDARRDGRAEAVVVAQLQAVLAAAGDAFAGAVVAYEPVWAIGTGETASPAQVQAMHAVLRATLAEAGDGLENTSLLYGGSVKPDNAATLFAQEDVDGGLVGGSSLDAKAFASIVAALGDA
ncbi:MAG TPA: triose-phosphate isomerase [Pseudomonadales bacterium]|nr:triose-phosphate isomerase [Pseudomonadales bacterium]